MQKIQIMKFFINLKIIVLAIAITINFSTVQELYADKIEVQSAKDLGKLSFEQLINLKVTSVSKKKQSISESPAAIFVITQEDIRRSGVTNIPEALRLAPGLEVSRIDTNSWAITSRGFNGAFANKLLVLMDGRSVYTPVFSGVFWDTQDTLIEDIDRIEVIRGPGATLWGSNAVNGVINIITKNSKDTQGGLVSVGGGTDERGFVGTRYGDKLSENSTYKIYAKYFDRDNYKNVFGEQSNDDWNEGRAGMRFDSENEQDKYTLQGDFASGRRGLGYTLPKFAPPYSQNIQGGKSETTSGNLIGRWVRTLSETSDFQIQTYYDYSRRSNTALNHTLNTGDLDFQHRFQLVKDHEIIWGGGYRRYWDDISDSEIFDLGDNSKALDLITGFVQDEISIIDKELRPILGSKFEKTEFTGFELQPNARMIYQMDQQNSIWGSVSRAVRTPSRLEQDSRLLNQVLPGNDSTNGLPSAFVGISTDTPRSENLLAYELGLRSEVNTKLFFDTALFYNRYSDLLSTEPSTPYPSFNPVPHLEIPIPTKYTNKASTYGAEIVAEYKPYKSYRFVATYTYLESQYDLPDNSRDPVAQLVEGQTPQNQFMLRSLIDLPYDLEFDSTFRYVDKLPSIDVDDYFNLDLRVGWRPCKNWEFSIVGQNLIDAQHLQYVGQDFVGFVPVEIQRGVYGKVMYRW